MLLGLTREEISSLLHGLGAESYRADQLMRGLYRQRIRQLGELTVFSRGLRSALSTRTSPGRLEVRSRELAPDGTVKLLVGLADREAVECVAIPAGRRRTACLSSQVGCAFGCRFCATARMGLRRNLRAGEMIAQFLELAEEQPPLTNVVFMGMGEPLANYAQTMRAVRLLNSPDALGVAARKIRISTVGLAPQMGRLAREGLELGLTISLGAPRDDLRSRLIPVNRTYPLRKVLRAAHRFTEAAGRMVTFAYVMVPGVNDSLREGRELVSLLRGMPCKLNLLPYNPHPELPRLADDPEPGPTEDAAGKEKAGIKHPLVEYLAGRLPHVTFRVSRGLGIRAACGQLYYAGHRRGPAASRRSASSRGRRR